MPLRPRVRGADTSLRPTRAEVLLDAIGHNLRVVRAAAKGCKVLAVVKADAYGHGVVPVAQRLQAEGVDGFGVLVLNGISGGAHRDIIAAGLTPVLYEISEASAFDAVSAGRPIDVHLKVDTGMGRLGVPLGELDEFLRELRRFPSIRIVGLMTHLSTADTDPDYVAEQIAGFAHAQGLVRRFGHEPAVLHAANSAACFRHPETHFDWVRPGIALYGYPGSSTIDAPLRPAMRWRTEVLRIRTLETGDSAGYGRSFRAAST
ncbi:MAG: alanine racemase, partial [Deltaproteobacteria bacterium]|nr:alanine racemase [Deltaproteobacteria bacterium]